jgi:hypothetical protein
MILLELFIIVIGLAISLMSLKKVKPNETNSTKRILAVLYISLCILSFILIVIKSEDTEESGFKLFNSLNKLEKVITSQSDNLITLIDSINAIKGRMDNIVKKTEEAIVQREISQTIFDAQNRLLEKSNELTQKQIEDAKPKVHVYTEYITFSELDTSKTQQRIVFKNEGKRIAQNVEYQIVSVLKNKIDNKYFFHNTSLSLIPEIYPSTMSVSTSQLPLRYQDILAGTNGGIIIITMRYFDELLHYKTEKQLIFRIEIDANKIKIFKESNLPADLEIYLSRYKIKLVLE